jgi:hemerythrin superfamily protein
LAMDAITLLKNDHRAVEKLFKAFEGAGERALKTKADIVHGIVSELSVHAQAEEQVLYPAIRTEVPDTEEMVLESLEEHHIVKWVLSELEDMSPEDERFAAKVTVLIENVRHHVDEEEHDLFPRVRASLGRKQLSDIGAVLERAKKTASKRPHPRAADTPPANAVAGLVSGVMNRAVSGARQVEGKIVKR